MLSVAVLLTTGIANSWFLLEGPAALVTTGYGRLVLVKIGIFVGMVAIAAANRFRVTPQLPAAKAMETLRRNAQIETALGLCVLAIVGALGTMAPPTHHHNITTSIPPDAAFVHIHSTEAMANVTIDPGQSGRALALIQVLHEDGTEYPARAVRLELEPKASGIKAIGRSAVSGEDGTWRVVDLNVPPGIWTVRVVITGETGSPFLLDAPIVVDK
jgi:hypothetical protein